MPECFNCGSPLAERYVRNFTPGNTGVAWVCPYCEIGSQSVA